MYRFTLLEGPAWVQLDEETGELSGTPGSGSAGTYPVAVRLETLYPDEVPPDSKVGASFQKRRNAPEPDRTTVHRFDLTVREAP